MASSRRFSSLSFANGLNTDTLSAQNKAQLYNFVNGKWTSAAANFGVVDPLNGEVFINVCWVRSFLLLVF